MEREATIMNEQMKALLKSKIDSASVISFDIFDTLLFRKVNTPETVFELVGKHFGIYGFRKLRIDEQNEASRRAYASHGYPHADMDQIYDVLAEHTEIPVDWNSVKEYEIQMERDALVANDELMEYFLYAKAQGKRVVATTDMYLSARILTEILEDNGFVGFDRVYCSADEHKAKFNKELFELVAQEENVPYEEILHIGDKARDDGEFPGEYGINTFVYNRNVDMERVRRFTGSDVDEGLYKILCNGEQSFWYELGVEIGGPLYMGLYRFLCDKVKKEGKEVYFLSRDGYNLYHIFRNWGFENIHYLYTSRRALTLAAVRSMNDEDIESLPPYTYGQTVGELLDYLCIDRNEIKHLQDAGLESFDAIIETEQDRDAFRKLYVFDKEVFLAQAEIERENALKYYDSIGFLDEDAICFDCGWQGSSQSLLERFKAAVGCDKKHFFYYFGIKNSEKSRRQLRSMHYDTYLFDFYRNYALQDDMRLNVMYELFFSAPHESVFCYDRNGGVVFENGGADDEKSDILRGICDYMALGIDFVEKYDVEYTPEIAVKHLKRLIHLPTENEAVMIGNLQNVDGFARKQGETKYVAYATKEQLENNANIEIYWLNGLLKRPDVSEEIKKECAARMGVQYPAKASEYHLEDEQSILNYHRWIKFTERFSEPVTQLEYSPSFSVVIPVYNTVTEQLEECIQSVLSQTYENFELIMVDDHSTWDNVRPVLQKYEAHEKVKVIYRETNGHISVATNQGIDIASGEFIVFMDCDDFIEKDALYEFAKKLNENPELDFIYSDEDKITEDGKIRHMPFFKPDWSPDLFMNMMYTNHLATYRASIVKAVGGLRTAFNGSQDYDFTLRFMERSDNSRVGHISRILYHWRERKESVAFAMSSKSYAAEAARYAKEDYIRRNGLKAHLEPIFGMNQYRMVYEVTGEPMVSIIIPSKDHPEILEQCINSVIDYTSYKNYEIIVVDNGSTDENRDRIAGYLSDVGAGYYYEKAQFNFSKMCNIGASHAKGQYLLFLNDDIEIFQPQWLERMLGHAQKKHIGAVGAKLFYPTSTIIQHSGVSNPRNGPFHSLIGCDDHGVYYFGWNWVDNNPVGVTGACLMLAADKFEEVGGFDENMPVAYNDVKLCFALVEKGYYNVVRNDVVAYHHESLSRGTDQEDEKKLVRMMTERTNLFARFPGFKDHDPFLNKNLECMSRNLNLQNYYDAVEEIDVSDCKPFDSAAIDSVGIAYRVSNNVADRVRIIGWSILDGEDHIEELDRYLVLEDPFGRTYGARVISSSRMDVAEHFGDERYMRSGFECILRKLDIRMDVMCWRLGVMVRARDGEKYLKWCSSTPVVREKRARPIPLGSRALDNFAYAENSPEIRWYLDECRQYEHYYRLRGFAFRCGDTNYRYDKSVVLVDADNNAVEYDVHLEERIDVACAFEEELFLFDTGFDCYIYNGELRKDTEYEVYIRLTDRYNPGNVYEIKTEGKVKLQ